MCFGFGMLSRESRDTKKKPGQRGSREGGARGLWIAVDL